MVEQDPAIPPAPLAIYTDFQQDAPKAVLDEMRAEAEAILAPAGLRFEWRPLAGFRPDIVSAAVVVAHFHDRCDAAGLVMRGNRPGSLAWTDMSDGRPLPFIHVDCGRVRTFLQTALLGHRLQDRDLLYGCALGRVLAHELCHAIAASPDHAPRGVAREDYLVEDLLSPAFRLESGEIEVFRASSAMEGLRAASPR